MVPEEEQSATSEQTQNAPAKGPRRSRRGGRRRSQRRRENLPLAQPVHALPPAHESAPAAIGEAEQKQQFEPEPQTPSVSVAIEQVNQVIEELKTVLNEMEEVLETLELAERQKIDDEREIDSLQRALRQLHRPVQTGQRHR